MLVEMFLSAFLAASPPIEIVIDCSSWHGKADTRLTIRFEDREGKAIQSNGELPAGTDPSSPRTGLRLLLEDNGWRFAYGENYTVIVRGSKTSPVRSVTFKSDGWIPTYLIRPAPMWLEIAPPPHEKK